MNTTKTNRRRSRLAQLVGALALISALAIPAAASAAKTQTAVTINPAAGAFVGKITSDKPACKRGRTVELFHVEQNGDRLLGTFVTPDRGKAGPWGIAVDPAIRGTFYVDVAGNDKCKDTRSVRVQALPIPGFRN